MNQTAQGLAALGRGPDTQLVHMAPSEINSLQQLAMAHGGSLTINPETGLPEAGFLSSILPMVLGAGAMMIPGLQGVGAAGIGLGIGGLQALRTGSLKKGLMAGFGAYGGASLGSALASAGGANMAAAGGVNPANIAGPAVPSIEAFNPSNVTASAGQKMLAGAQGLGSEAGRNAFMSQIGGAKGLGMAGLAAAAPMMMETTTKQPEIKSDANMGQRYQFNAGTQTPTPTPDVPEYGNQGINFGKEQRYFNPMYRPIDNDAARRMYGFASGGPVEAMSNANAIGMNTGYPQSAIRTGAYATPDQQPISRDMLPYPGQPQFAGGGSINLQGTFDMGGGQGGGQMGGSNNPQPFVGNNNAPSTGLQTHKVEAPSMGLQTDMRYRGGDGVTPSPFSKGFSGMPGGLQGLLKGPMSQGMAFAEGGEVGGYTYDPVTQMYVKKAGEGATMVSPTGGISGASAGSGYEQPLNPKTNDYLTWEETTPEGQKARDARMAQVQGLFSLGPLGAITKAITGRESVPFDLNSLLGTPQAYTDYQSNFARGMDPMSGPGTIGSRDTYGSNESNPGGGDFGYSVSDNSDSVGRAKGGLAKLAQGGISNLGDYSDGGRLLRGPGDGISDSIPAMIGKKQPARLADGEFVVPARIVSELGNGSTEAGARKLYAMMDRVQKARKKTVGKGKVAANSRSAKYLPA